MNNEYKAFIALVAIAGIVISALLLPSAQSDDIFIISSGNGTSSSGVSSLTSANSAVSLNASSGHILVTPKWQLLAQNSTISGSSSGTTTIVNQNLGSVSNLAVATNVGNLAAAEKLNANSILIGQTVNKLTVGLKKVGTPTVTLTACVLDASNNCLYTFGSIASATLTTSYVQYSFTGTGAYTLSVGEYVGIKSSGLTGAGNQVEVSATTPNQYDTTNSVVSQFSGSWVDANTWDLGSSTANGAWLLERVGSTYIEADFTSKKHLLITAELRYNASFIMAIRMNNDTGNNYAIRTDISGTTTSLTSQSYCNILNSATITTGDRPLLVMWIDNNQSGDRKIILGDFGHGLDTNASTAPSNVDFSCKWSNTSDQINNVVIIGALTTGSIITVWGYD